MFRLLAAILLAIALAPAALARADTCGTGGFAVGGYPATERIPDGYEYVPTPGGIFPWDAGGYNHGQKVGAAALVAAVDAHAAQCGGPIRIHGHSYGAAIVHTAMETIDRRDYAPRVSAHVTGNPRRAGGIEDTFAGSTVLPGATMRGAGTIPTRSLWRDDCNEGRDYICSAPMSHEDPAGSIGGATGYLFGSGHVYGSTP